MKISLIISTYNKPEYLEQVLKSINELPRRRAAGYPDGLLNDICAAERRGTNPIEIRLTNLPGEIIIADDGSGHETSVLIERYRSQIAVPLFHEWQEDLGYRLSRSRNNGLLKSTGDYLIFVDDDLVLHPKFITDHRNCAKSGYFYCGTRARLGENLTSSIMKNYRNIVFWWEANLQSRLNTIRIPFLHKIIKGPNYTYKRLRGCHMAFWKNDLVKVNGFDERYTSWGREDSDIAMRLMHAGVKRINLKWTAICYHLNHQISKADSRNDHLLFETIRNKTVQASIGIRQHI